MSKLVKELITQELQQRYGKLDSALWVELVGIDGITTNEFRRDLRTRQMRLEIIKTSLFRRAVADGPLQPLARTMAGPAALLTGGESVIEIAKLLEEWRPKLPGLKLRGAVVEGEFVDERRVDGVASMPTKRDLQARVAATVRAPGAKLAAAILAGGGNIAACVKDLIEKLEKGETILAKSA
jgi:large subunit ribosomal protein L10